MRIALYKLILVAALAIGASIGWSSAAAQSPGAVTVNPSGIVYYAQPGDTLMSIAHRFTNKTTNWIRLSELNRVAKDHSIPIGTGIVIPADLLTDEPSEATVIARNGSITAVYPDGNTGILNIGSKVVEGMKIHTGTNSFLTLSLADESRISLPSNSSVQLARLRKALYTGSPRVEVTLLRGRVVSRVSPLETNKGRFEVRTPLSVAGVRGTNFRVGFNNNRAVTEVLDGRVATSSPTVPDTRLLNPVKGNIINRTTVGPAIDLLPPPQLGALPYRQAGAARFMLAPVTGARAYHVQLATDPDMLHLLAEASGSAGEVVIDDIQEGKYFAQLSAVDGLGLEGMPRVVAVTIRNRVNPADNAPMQPAPSVATSDPRELVLQWQGSPTGKYNIQVARDPEFSWLVFTTAVTGNEAKFSRPSFGTYFARVQSVNADGSTNPFSFTQTLIVTDQWIINDGHPLPSKKPSNSASR